MATTAATKLSKVSQRLLVSYINNRFLEFPMENTRTRLEAIDKAIQLESDKRKKVRKEMKKDFYQDTEIATVRSPVSKLANFLIDMFAGPKMFESVSNTRGNEEQVKQQNAVIDENSAASNWTREMILYFRDIAKYPYAAISCNWEREATMSVLSDNTDPDATAAGAAVKTVEREGNVLRRKDPYNSFYDTSVPLNEVHSKGEFSGEIMRMSQVALYKLIQNLQLGDDTVMNEEHVWGKASTSGKHYRRPDVLPEHDKEEQNLGWGNGFFRELGINDSMQMKKLEKLNQGARYEVVRFNARIIPSMFNMKVPAENDVQIWQIYMVNWDTIIYAKRLANAHSYLPDIYTQVLEDGLGEQTKSYAELVIPMQNVSTAIMDCHLASMKRSLDDRALFDSARIKRTDIDGTNPSAKIAVRTNMAKPGLSDAYLPIPFRDDNGATRLNTMAVLANLANEAVGFNRPQQGQFQKGNKTLGEFNEVMNNADDDLRTIAKLVHGVAMVPLKHMIKTNIIQYQPVTTVVDRNGERIDVNPATIRRAAMQFKLADGLTDKDQILDLPTANTMLNLVMQIPALQQRYDVVGLINYIFSSVGFDTSQFDNGGQGGNTPGAAGQPPTGGANAPQQ